MNRNEINEDIKINGIKIFDSLKEKVINDSTISLTNNTLEHESNKNKLKTEINKIIDESIFNLNISDEKLWQIIWERIRYAGIRASIATNEIKEYRKNNVFDDLKKFSLPEWDFDINEWKLYKKSNDKKNFIFKNIGFKSRDLLNKTGNFSGLKIVSNFYKLDKTIRFARDFYKFRSNNINSPALNFFIGDDFDINNLNSEKFWSIQKNFESYLGFITSLHVMMDLGLPTVKPDKILTYVLAKLSLLTVFESSVSREDVNKKYQKQAVAEDVINTALELSKNIKDSKNPIREIDIWLVKFAQDPEPSFGITVNLEKTIDLCKLAENIRLNNS